MSIQRVKEFFRSLGREQDILEFETSSSTVELAAQAAGVIPSRIAKTLSFLVEDTCVLVVCAGDTKVDNHKFKEQFHCKVKMLSYDQVSALVGHDVGGVCPFSVNEGVQIFLDRSLQRFSTVFPAAGSSNSAIELTCDELEHFSGSLGWIDVCKGWQENKE